jgi:hypothetical protein
MEFLETSLNDFDILVVTETQLDNQINITHLHLDLDPGVREGRQKRESIGD